jgi:hypothetical protein
MIRYWRERDAVFEIRYLSDDQKACRNGSLAKGMSAFRLRATNRFAFAFLMQCVAVFGFGFLQGRHEFEDGLEIGTAHEH